MLNNEKIKVSYYIQDSSKVFSNTTITGGVAITIKDDTKNYGKIGEFIAFDELKTIIEKVWKSHDKSLDTEIRVQSKFNLEQLYLDYPQYKNLGNYIPVYTTNNILYL